MTVTAIMPTYNQREFIELALAGAYPQVDELIIVNDGSTDGTAEFLTSFAEEHPKARVVHKSTNGGVAAAINAGFAHATGEWVTWISSDNEYRDGWIESLMVHAGDGVGGVVGAYIRREGRNERYVFRPYAPDRQIRGDGDNYSVSFIVRRSIWEGAGPHCGGFAHDYDHWLRLEEECWCRDLEIRSDSLARVVYLRHPGCGRVTRSGQNDTAFWKSQARQRRA